MSNVSEPLVTHNLLPFIECHIISELNFLIVMVASQFLRQPCEDCPY